MSTARYQVVGLQKSYRGRLVLDIPRLTIMDRELFVIVGPSGAGKSTLLRLLHFLEPPSRGEIHFDGQRVSFPPPLALRRQISMVFQRPEIIRGTVWQNVALGLRLRGENRPERVENALEMVGLSGFGDLPVNTLSGGELQRVALARAIVVAPRVILLDEPTANLDPHNVHLVEKSIRDLHHTSGATIVLVTHNIFQARRLAERVGFLLNGKLVEVSPAEQFFENPKDERSRAFVRGEMVY